MGRFSHSWDLFTTSLGVIRQDKELMWMPVLSALASIITVLAIAGVGLAFLPQTRAPDGSIQPLGMALAATMYVVLAFVTLFFNAAVVAAANERLGGGDPTVGSALKAAWARKGRLFLWAIVVATVNVILQALRERSGMAGQIATSLAGVAWNLATYFMVPVLLFDDKGIGKSLRHSGGIFKRTWGETVIGQGGIGLASFAMFALTAIAGFALTYGLSAILGGIGAIVGIVVTVLALIVVAALSSVVAGVYKAALYRHATGAGGNGPFGAQDLGGAFVPR